MATSGYSPLLWCVLTLGKLGPRTVTFYCPTLGKSWRLQKECRVVGGKATRDYSLFFQLSNHRQAFCLTHFFLNNAHFKANTERRNERRESSNSIRESGDTIKLVVSDDEKRIESLDYIDHKGLFFDSEAQKQCPGKGTERNHRPASSGSSWTKLAPNPRRLWSRAASKLHTKPQCKLRVAEPATTWMIMKIWPTKVNLTLELAQLSSRVKCRTQSHYQLINF